VTEEGDTLTVYPSKPDELHGAEIETYNDHRMAMCFAILGLKIPGIKIKNPACVKKTFPNFFQKLAAPPPNGLGASIWDAKRPAHAEIERAKNCLRIEVRRNGLSRPTKDHHHRDLTLKNIVIAIDGTSASGKSTNAKLVARALNTFMWTPARCIAHWHGIA
jgi:hypothetical protein